MDWQWPLVLGLEGVAVGYLVYAVFFRKRVKRARRPDVPVSKLLKKRPSDEPPLRD